MTTQLAERGSHLSRRPNGPNAGVLAVITLVLVVAAVVAPSVVTGHPGYIRPTASQIEVSEYFATSAQAARLSALFQFAGAIPLGIMTATLYAHLRRLGLQVPGPSIGYYGGVVASALILVSAGATWSAAELGGGSGAASNAALNGASGAVLHALVLLAFVTGGVGYVVPLGLLVAGVAVPALILRLIPRVFAWAGLVIALVCQLATLGLLSHAFDLLLPIGRFASLLWLVVVGFTLPAEIRRRTDRRPVRGVSEPGSEKQAAEQKV